MPSDPITISLAITDPTNANNLGLSIATDKRYLQIPHGFDSTITWNLDGAGTDNAQFDNPPIIFNGDIFEPEITNQQPKTLTVLWSNLDTDLPSTGVSHYYTLEIFVDFAGVRVPLAHDPTVHNDPPTP